MKVFSFLLQPSVTSAGGRLDSLSTWLIFYIRWEVEEREIEKRSECMISYVMIDVNELRTMIHAFSLLHWLECSYCVGRKK